jgi:hypothetical protein
MKDVGGMTISQLLYWHGRAVAWSKRPKPRGR